MPDAAECYALHWFCVSAIIRHAQDVETASGLGLGVVAFLDGFRGGVENLRSHHLPWHVRCLRGYRARHEPFCRG